MTLGSSQPGTTAPPALTTYGRKREFPARRSRRGVIGRWEGFQNSLVPGPARFDGLLCW
jgi:hypothetical protein